MTLAADYVVVGAGSAGCVIAARLSEDGARVVLLEAGTRDWHPMIHIPAGVGHLLANKSVNWNFATEPEPSSGNRAIHWPRGRVLGGTSSINGMLYVRGNAADYDGWAQLGCRGWSYDDVLPLFQRAERYAGGDDAYRGRSGPLHVTDYDAHMWLTHLFVEAAQQIGFAFNPDQNGARQDGVGYAQMTRRGRFRGSTARTYLVDAKTRANLHIETMAQATGLVIDGKRCTGVRYRRHNQDMTVTAAREVIICGGTNNSPHLLQVSGIGPASHLSSIGIEVTHDLPGVGANMADHFVIRVAHRLRDIVSMNQLARGLRCAREAARYALTGRGALTFGVTSAMVFCHSRDGLASPDLQLLFTPASYGLGPVLALESEPGMTVAVCPVRPSSRGTIMAASADPLAPPAIRPNYLSDRDDLRVLTAGLRTARQILNAPAFARYNVTETVPGPDVDTDDSIAEFARDYGNTLYHPVGTCKMGTDPMAVVDPRLRVHGIGGLRVADASIMPTLTSGNTNAPTIMIGEKAAALILEDAA